MLVWVYQPPTPYTDMYLYLVDDESDEKPKRVLHLQFRQQYDTHTHAHTRTRARAHTHTHTHMKSTQAAFKLHKISLRWRISVLRPHFFADVHSSFDTRV